MALTWAQEQRVNWIAEMLDIYGFINREHIMKKFRVSAPQAASDIGLYRKSYPGDSIYDSSAKKYLRSPSP